MKKKLCYDVKTKLSILLLRPWRGGVGGFEGGPLLIVIFQLKKLRTKWVHDFSCCLSSTGQQGVSTDNADQVQNECSPVLVHYNL